MADGPCSFSLVWAFLRGSNHEHSSCPNLNETTYRTTGEMGEGSRKANTHQTRHWNREGHPQKQKESTGGKQTMHERWAKLPEGSARQDSHEGLLNTIRQGAKHLQPSKHGG